MRECIADGLFLVGVTAIVAACYCVSPLLGLGVFGGLAIILGITLATRGVKRDDR